MRILTLSLAPVLDTAVYAANDLLFDTTACAGQAMQGKIMHVVGLDKDDLGETCYLIFLKSNVSMGTRNSVPTITDTAAMEIVGVTGNIAMTTDFGANRIGSSNLTVPIPFNVEDAGGVLYVAAITTTALTHTAAGVTFNITVEVWP